MVIQQLKNSAITKFQGMEYLAGLMERFRTIIQQVSWSEPSQSDSMKEELWQE